MKKKKQKARPQKRSKQVIDLRPQTLALLPTREIVALPGLIIPIIITEGKNAEAVSYALQHNRFVALTLQTGSGDDKPSKHNLRDIGTYAQIAHSIRLSNGDLRVRLHVQGRIRIKSFTSLIPFVKAKVEYLDGSDVINLTAEQEKLVEDVRQKFTVLAKYDPSVDELVSASQDLFDPGALADLIGAALPLETVEGQKVLEETKPLKRLQLVKTLLNAQVDVAAIKERISNRAEKEIGRAQHEQLLREQLRQIQVELGDEESIETEMAELKMRAEKAKMPADAKSEVVKQIRRLEQLHPDTSEAALARTYLDTILELPWSKKTRDQLSLKVARRILEEDHYGLEKTKERILDYLGVRKLKKGARGPILLLVGPPGVGKTSLGRSIARALDRKFVRVSLGGLRDEAELRGHRRTYVGALPGRIIQGLNTAGTKNPVFMLDEIDKVGSDFRGDPASVLLEILDPEQNRNFEDHYLNLPFDLSEVMFICTANITDTIPTPLLDRMEIIDIAGYTTEEKLEISKRYIVPREEQENGVQNRKLHLTDNAILHLINCYTRESGVRELGRNISTVFRKIARMVAEGGKPEKRIAEDLVETFLGPLRYVPDKRLSMDEIGVVSGLAWTSTGGEIMTLEASITKGKGSLSLTGQMGEVMRESAMAALTYVLSTAEKYGIDPGIYEQSSIHVHVPQGAIPKDGPSAGIAIASALVSLLTNRPISRNVAMTGEITLRGSVLAVGGLKEKALAALRVGIPVVIIPKENERELVEFPKYLLDQVTFVPVESIDEVLRVALVPDNQLEDKKPSEQFSQKRQLPPLIIKPSRPTLS